MNQSAKRDNLQLTCIATAESDGTGDKECIGRYMVKASHLVKQVRSSTTSLTQESDCFVTIKSKSSAG